VTGEQVESRALPLQEAKLGSQFDHRTATFVGVGDTDIRANGDHSAGAVILPRYWVSEVVTKERLGRRNWGCRTALLGHRRVARNTDERTSIATLLPWGAASYGWILTAGPSASELLLLCGVYNSFVFDYSLRNATSQPSVTQGTSEQQPAPPPITFQQLASWAPGEMLLAWFAGRLFELTYTAWDMQPFAADLGDGGPPFRWDDHRRAVLRAELDAAYFHLYGLDRDDTDYVVETFPIVKRKDEASFGEFRTKRLILEAYDAMADAIRAGTSYVSPLDPPPGHGPRHPAREGVA
jgi:hypothetical protein